MIQGCFSNPGSPPLKINNNVSPHITNTNTSTSTNNNTSTSSSNSTLSKDSLITCVYSTRLFDSTTHLTLTWFKSSSTHSLTLHVPEYFSLTLSLLPSTFFRSRSGSKTIRLDPHHGPANAKIKVYYDFARADSGRAEPESGFYLAIVRAGRVEFRVGDMAAELARRLGVSRLGDSGESGVVVSRREHVFGRRSFTTRADPLGIGPGRTLEIECSSGAMRVKLDGETKLLVKKLAWKFRGNEKIFIDGVMVEFYWDVFNWTNSNNNYDSNYNNKSILSDRNNNNNNNNNNNGNAVFVFRVGEGGVSPEVVGPEKKLIRKNSPSAAVMAAGVGAGAGAGAALSPAGSSSSVWQWAEESSDCGRSSSGSSSTTGVSSGSFSGGGGGGGRGGGGGFSLVLYAWKRGQ